MDDSAERGGLFRDLRAFLAACARYAGARFRLASLEGKDAARHAFKLLALLLAALLIVAFAWLFLCLAAVFLLAQAFGGSHGWLWASLIMAGAHFVVATALVLAAKSGITKPLFPLTAEELKKDQQWLETPTEPK